MKLISLFSCILLSITSSNAMLKEQRITPTEEASILTLPLFQRALALRLVMINCLDRKDYVGASHLIAKTKLYPGSMFIKRLESGFFYDSPTNHQQDICYLLYIASKNEEHKRTRKLLSDAYCLPRIYMIQLQHCNSHLTVDDEKEYYTQWKLFQDTSTELETVKRLNDYTYTPYPQKGFSLHEEESTNIYMSCQKKDSPPTKQEKERILREHNRTYLERCATYYLTRNK